MDNVDKIFLALSDPVRLRSLALMAQEGELCVCELTYALGVSQPRMSRHLASLRDIGMVTARRSAQWIFYSLPRDHPGWMEAALSAIFAGLSGYPLYQADVARLRSMPDRPKR